MSIVIYPVNRAMLTPKQLLTGVFFTCVVGCTVPSAAALQSVQDAPPPTSPDAFEEWYISGATLLKRGHDFEKAAVQLRKAIALQDKYNYHAALGCALVSRAASLADAMNRLGAFTTDQAKYKQWLTVWEAAQKDHDSALYGKPRPQPPILITQDDKRPFTQTAREAKKQFDALSKEAQTEWNVALASAKSPADRAEMSYVRGWGLFLLRTVAKDIDLPDLPDEEEIIRAFTTATDASPNVARYWQSLGDGRLRLQWNLDKIKNKPEIIEAYQRSLKLRPDNANLCYRLYTLTRTDFPEQAKNALRQASLADPDNAFPAYRLAGLLLYDTPYKTFHTAILDMVRKNIDYDADAIIRQIRSDPNKEKNRLAAQEAITLIERGNQAQRFVGPLYTPALPDLLAEAWSYKDHSGLNDTASTIAWQSVRLPAGGYAVAAAYEGDRPEALRASRAVLGMGFKMMGSPNPQEMSVKYEDEPIMGVSMSNVGSGYRTLIDVYKALGDTVNAERAAAEYGAFETKVSAFWKAQNAAHQTSYLSPQNITR